MFGQIHDVWEKAIQIGNLIKQGTTLDILFEILGVFIKIANMILIRLCFWNKPIECSPPLGFTHCKA
jgi:hypothetical protein